MGIRLGLVPTGCEDNDVYNYLLEEFEVNETDCWGEEELLAEFGKEAVEQLEQMDFICLRSDEHYQLSFNVFPTIPYKLVQMVAAGNRSYSFHEILQIFPSGGGRSCASRKMKDLLIFLQDFGQVETFPSPSIGFTWITGPSDFADDCMNKVHKAARLLEPAFLTQAKVNEGVTTLKKLIGS